MKKLKTLTLSLLIGASIISCKPSADDALKYNDELIGIETKLSAEENIFLDIIYTDSTNEQKNASYAKLVSLAKESVELGNKMADFDKSSEYKDAGKAYFTAIQGLCDNEYKQLLALNCLSKDSLTEEHDAQHEALIKAIAEKSEVALKTVQTAQTVFSTKYKIAIEETPAEKK